MNQGALPRKLDTNKIATPFNNDNSRPNADGDDDDDDDNEDFN